MKGVIELTRAKKALSQVVLLISGAIMLGFGAMRGEVETVLSNADMIGLVCNTIRKLFCMSDEGYEIFLMDLEDYKTELEEEDEE